MSEFKRLSRLYKTAERISFDDNSKIVLMSDCHRGDGSWADDFYRNRNIYFAALNHYHNDDYTYIELGDGDELWENSKFSEIASVHRDVFLLLNKFIASHRLYFIYGNHDMIKKTGGFAGKIGLFYFDERETRQVSYTGNAGFYEGLVLEHADSGNEIFLVHGHQVDFFNDRLWLVARFLVRYLWKPLELFGINDPTSSAKNYTRKKEVEKKLVRWVEQNNCALIAGHTHRPVFPETGEPPYFNDGSCVHPCSVTSIEITQGYISLVKWSVKTRNNGTLYVGREIIAGPEKMELFFKKSINLSKNL